MMFNRDLVVFDLETTGTNTQVDRIVQFGAVRAPGMQSLDLLINPGVSIVAEVSAVHGITDEMVADAPGFDAVADEIVEFMAGADFGGYNVLGFDLPLLQVELERCGCVLDLDGVQIVDGLQIYRHYEPLTLARALRFYCGCEHQDAHTALADARATLAVILGQAGRYEKSLGELADLSMGNRATVDGKVVWDQDGCACLSFGKHANVPLEKTDKSYLRWLLNQSFSFEVKMLVQRALAGEVLRRTAHE